MQKRPKIAVITPVFNLIKSGRAEFIKQNIESVHNQTYNNLEHIIQDGASDDGTYELLKDYADKGWITLYSEKDINVHDAINKAVKKIDADFIAVLGGDDYYKDNDIVEYIVNNYLQDETVDYTYGDEEHISCTDGSYIRTWYGNAHEQEFWRGVCYPTGSIIMSKKIFEEVGMFDTKYAVVADLKLLMSFKFNDYKCAYCNRVVNVFREGEGLSSSSKTKLLHTKEYAEICSEFWSEFDSSITPEKAELMIKYTDYDDLFLIRLKNFIFNKKLKNIDYEKLKIQIEGLNNIHKSLQGKKQIVVRNEVQTVKDKDFNLEICLYPFKNFPILKILKNKKEEFINYKIYLFSIPIVKVRKIEKGE